MSSLVKCQTFLLIAGLNLVLSGCDATLLSDVKELDKAVSVSATAIQKTYGGVNDFCRQAYLNRVRFDPTMRIKHRRKDGELDVLVCQYSSEDIQVRKLALQGLIEYCSGLAAIAGSDSPAEAGQAAAKFSEQLSTTADSLQKLTSTIEQKSGTPGTKVKFAQVSKPLSILAKLAAEQWVKKMQKDSLKQCINAGYENTEKTFDLLEADLADMYHFAYEENAELMLLGEEMYYNNRYVLKNTNNGAIPEPGTPEFKLFLDAISDKSRGDFINEIGNSAKSFASIRDSSPLPLIQTMRVAHQRLHQYVNKDSMKTKGDLLAAVTRNDDSLELKNKVRGESASLVESFRAIKNSIDSK